MAGLVPGWLVALALLGSVFGGLLVALGGVAYALSGGPPAPEETDGDAEEPDVDDDRRVLGQLLDTGHAIGVGLATLAYSIYKAAEYTVYGFCRVLPLSHHLYRKLLRLAMWRYQRTGGADAVGLHFGPNGQVKPRLLNWVDRDTDEGRRAGWTIKGRDATFNPGTEGSSTDRFGAADVVILDELNPAQVEPWEARYQEALDLGGRKLQLFKDAVLEQVIVENPDRADGDAVADGGVQRQHAGRITLANPGQWAESLVDISAGPGYDGLTVHPRKAKEIMTAKIDPEDLDDAEKRGHLAALMDDNNMDKRLIIELLVVAAMTIFGFYAEEIFAGLFGSGGGGAASSGGGGGGSLLPTMIDASQLALQTLTQVPVVT
jgi:hypothetical protein